MRKKSSSNLLKMQKAAHVLEQPFALIEIINYLSNTKRFVCICPSILIDIKYIPLLNAEKL